MNKIRIVALLSVLATVVVAQSAFAWTSLGRWKDNSYTLRASSVSFANGSPWRSSLSTVATTFNQNPSKLRVTQAYDDTKVRLNNFQNEVWFSNDSAHSPAVCYYWLNVSGWLRETDVVFWTGIPYTTSMNKTSLTSYGGNLRPFQTTALHEYGHSGGLGHENDEYNIMGQDWTHVTCNGNTARSYVGEDGADGLHDIYGSATGAFEDLSVTVFKRTGANGEYSTHGFCDVRTTGGALLPRASDYEGQPRWIVSPGQTVSVEFTYENNGRSLLTHDIIFVTSLNNWISLYDYFTAPYWGQSVGRGDVMTTSYNVTIPNHLTPGTTYFLGVIADWTDNHDEISEANNMAYHVFQVQ